MISAKVYYTLQELPSPNVGCRGASGDAVASSARAGLFTKEFEAAAGPFAKELEVAAGPLAKGVLAPAYEEDEACAFVLPPARRTGRVRSSCRRPEVSDDDLWLGGW